jgi:hypothetical protein
MQAAEYRPFQPFSFHPPKLSLTDEAFFDRRSFSEVRSEAGSEGGFSTVQPFNHSTIQLFNPSTFQLLQLLPFPDRLFLSEK